MKTRAGSAEAGLRAYVRKVFTYMGLSLALTGVVAYFTVRTGLFAALLSPSGGFSIFGWVVAFGPLALILFMRNLSASGSKALLFGVATLIGMSMSLWAFITSGTVAFQAFLLASILFGTMALFGYVTDKDLTKMGSILIMAMWGVLVVSIASIWFPVGIWLSYLIVAIFTGLVAYNVQTIKTIYYHVGGEGEDADRLAVLCALNLYISFINIFQSLMRIMNNNNN